MAFFLANRVHVETLTSGTADFQVGAAISTAYQSFSGASVPDGAQFSYTAYNATQFECGRATYIAASPSTVDRTAANVFAGTAGAGALTNFSTNPRLFIGPLAEDAPLGKMAIPIPAAAMVASTTNGAAAGTLEMATNKNMFITFDFDTTTSESVQFSMIMPPSWDEGTITFQPVWSHPSTATNFGVVFELSAVAISDNDAGDVAFGTGQTSTKTGGTTNNIYFGPESSAITISGTPTVGDLVMFKIARLPANGSDTLAVDARLHGIRLFITNHAGNDA
jgi:hypothetical protein